jgi:hypothetical protein
MSLPSYKMIDELFRETFLPESGAEAPDTAWESIVRRIEATSTHVDPVQAVANRPLALSVLSAYVHRWVSRLSWAPVFTISYWRRLGTWVHGANTLYPPSTNELDYLGPGGYFRPSAFAGVAIKQVLDLRLAS